jgi:hypothetical protein
MSKQLVRGIAANNVMAEVTGSTRVESAPLPAGARFLNVIEAVFSGMAWPFFTTATIRLLARPSTQAQHQFGQHDRGARCGWGDHRERRGGRRRRCGCRIGRRLRSHWCARHQNHGRVRWCIRRSNPVCPSQTAGGRKTYRRYLRSMRRQTDLGTEPTLLTGPRQTSRPAHPRSGGYRHVPIGQPDSRVQGRSIIQRAPFFPLV